MSYDLAVWEGDRPRDPDAAATVFDALYERHAEAEEVSPPTPKIAAFVESLLGQYPDLTELDDDVDSSPWAGGPLIDDATGPLVYLTIVHSRAEEMRSFVAAKAQEHGLVCFDPQTEEVLA